MHFIFYHASVSHPNLLVPCSHTAIRSHRSFSCIGPSSCNSPPLEIRTLLTQIAQKHFQVILRCTLWRHCRDENPLCGDGEEMGTGSAGTGEVGLNYKYG